MEPGLGKSHASAPAQPNTWTFNFQRKTVDRSPAGQICAKLSQPRNRILHKVMLVGKTPGQSPTDPPPEGRVEATGNDIPMTTKHIYFAGNRKKFRVRYDRIVSFDPYDNGFGIMRDAQTARPQAFRTGDGWFVYNLATNLAQVS